MFITDLGEPWEGLGAPQAWVARRSPSVAGGVRNDIVNLVVALTNSNADTGGDDNSNKGFNSQEHFNYKARIVNGGTIAPTTTRPW